MHPLWPNRLELSLDKNELCTKAMLKIFDLGDWDDKGGFQILENANNYAKFVEAFKVDSPFSILCDTCLSLLEHRRPNSSPENGSSLPSSSNVPKPTVASLSENSYKNGFDDDDSVTNETRKKIYDNWMSDRGRFTSEVPTTSNSDNSGNNIGPSGTGDRGIINEFDLLAALIRCFNLNYLSWIACLFRKNY